MKRTLLAPYKNTGMELGLLYAAISAAIFVVFGKWTSAWRPGEQESYLSTAVTVSR